MSQTRLQLRTSVINNTQRDDKVEFINQALNDALAEMSSRHTWRSLRTQQEVSILTDATDVAIPEGISHIVSVRVKNTDDTITHNLILKDKRELEKYYPALGTQNTSATPAYAYEEAGTLHFMPRASQDCTLIITGDINPGNLTIDTDVPSIVGSEPAIIAWATAEVFRSIQQLGDAQFWDNHYEKRLIILIRDDKSRPGQKRIIRGFENLPTDQYIVEPWKDPFAGQR